MRRTVRKFQALCLLGILLIFAMSMTVMATEGDGSEGEVIEEQTPYVVSLKGEEDRFTYTGASIKPEVKEVTYLGEVLKEELFEVSYSEEDSYINAGEHLVYITVKNEQGEEIETIEKKFEIERASIEDVQISLEKTKYTYNGKEQRPKVTVLLNGEVVSEENYTVTYSNNVEVGTAKVTVEGVENLTGSADAEYKIVVGTPTVSTSPYYNKIKISWKKVTGASGYAIYRSTAEKGTYTRIGTAKSGSTLTYTNTGLTTGKTYYYKVRAYRTINGKNVYGTSSAAKKQQVKPEKATISKVERSSATALKITWKKITGSTGYAVYRSTSENGEYTRIGTVKSGSTVTYTDKNCTCGRTYYYKVRAYRTQSKQNYYGTASVAMANNTVPGTVKISDNTTYGSTSISLKWNKVSYATGYRIYRSLTKSGGYEKVATLSGASTLSWKETGLDKKTTYYYKVRAYRKVDGKTIWGISSSAYTKLKSQAGWKYSTYDGRKVKLYYNAKGQLVKDVSNIIGKQSSYEIRVNKKKCTVTVYAKDGKNGYIIPVKAFICSPGQSTPVGTFYTPQKYRWHELMGPCWGQWCTRIHGGVLFHSVFYNSYNNNKTLSVSAYNKLGTICSHGCVRLTAGDAKWIYDNCKLKTKVIIYNSSKEGPLGKPTAYKLSSSHRWDPTDPNMKSTCAKKGCH